jgi:hypothetical protein
MFIYKTTKTNKGQKMAETLHQMGPPSERNTTTTGFEDPDLHAADFAAWEGPATGVHPTEAPLSPTTIENTDPNAAHFEAWATEVPTGVHPTEAPVSPTAELVRGAANRLANMLDNRALGKGERQANRAEQRDKAKELMRNTGHNVLNTALELGVTAASITYLTLGSSIDKTTKGIKIVHEKFTQIKINAQERRSQREANRYIRDHVEAIDIHNMTKQHIEAQAMDTQITTERREQRDRDHEEANAMQAQMDHMDDLHGQAFEMDDEITAEKAAERKREAMQRKAARKAHNRKRFTDAGTKTREYGAKVRRFSGRIGRAAMRFARRSRRAVAAGAKAAVNNWQQTA